MLICGIILMVVISILPVSLGTYKADEKVIRIGYDANSNFIKENEGNYYGYGVEYLEKIAEYTDWKYEYVKDKSWHASLDKLRNGEVDLLCTVHYTEERADEFIYSDIPLGYESSLLYAKSDSSIAYQDYEAMQGCRIGLLEESYSAQDFEQHALKQGIRYSAVFLSEKTT